MDNVAQRAFSSINTSISITMATRVSLFLSRFMQRMDLVLVAMVSLAVLVAIRRSGIVHGAYTNPLTTAKSIMGIVATNTIMQQARSATPCRPLC